MHKPSGCTLQVLVPACFQLPSLTPLCPREGTENGDCNSYLLMHYKFTIHSQIEVSCLSFVKFAALLIVALLRCLNISFAILFSIAAPIKNVFGFNFFFSKLVLILFSAELAVFQCSSAPAGSIPPFNSPPLISVLAIKKAESLAEPGFRLLVKNYSLFSPLSSASFLSIFVFSSESPLRSPRVVFSMVFLIFFTAWRVSLASVFFSLVS
jgi:hypothetical protein